MNESIGSYAFLPWLRQGVAQTITTTDGDASVNLRATAHVELTVSGVALSGPNLEKKVARDVELYGPGEVIGIESRAIVRTDPRPWITNVEPDYLAHIEFYEEDFPWRYTPAAPDAASRLRLRPWIALVVLKDTGEPATSEFRDVKAVAERPLPSIAVKDFAAFPPPDELWAWAHVHVNRHLGSTPDELVAADVPAAVARLETALAVDPDIAYSRIVCPRRLEENAGYHAFLVPSFERGRLAGLGMDPDQAPFASASAWVDYGGRPEPLTMPYYHRWYFRTGGAGDFEALVNLLKWKTADPRVGRRDMDVQAPGTNIPGILDPDLHGVLRLGGALRAPFLTLSPEGKDEFNKYENWAKADWPHPFQESLANFINLADAFTREPADDARTDAGFPPTEPGDVDPLITSPIYGEWHTLQHRLLKAADGSALDPDRNWLHELNLDPRHRVAAAFGGDVVRKNQEDYMEAAWKQVGDVLAHNQKMRIAQTWLSVNEAVLAKSVTAVAAQPSRLLALTAPLQTRVLSEGLTVRYARQQSLTPAVLTSPAIRRIARPGGPLARRLALSEGPHAGAMLEAVNAGEITAALPKTTPAGISTVETVAEASSGVRKWPPAWLFDLTRKAPWLGRLLVIVALVLLALSIFVVGMVPLFAVLAVLALAAAAVLEMARRLPTLSEALGEDLDKPDSIDHLAPGPGFAFGEAAVLSTGTGIRGPFSRDNPAARRFKAALKEWAVFYTASDVAGREVPRTRLDLLDVATTVAVALQPAQTIPKRFLTAAVLAPHIRDQIVELFDEIKYYPRVDEPMYRPLKELGDELFVPNLDRIERDSVVVLETNQDFIEAYMVGVNHEFSRELLWREYPTDMRGTYFRQFWDVTGHFDPSAADADALREKLYDIPPIHRWPRRSLLGEHDNRQTDPSVERNEIVLAIRGELLKKYPNTVVYAHAAKWQMRGDHVDPTKERQLVDIEVGELANPPTSKILTPLYEAKVDPDIYFFGFDLTPEAARGGTGENDTDQPGWFFVLKERPGEPRFGLDASRPAGSFLVTANDIAWSDAGVAPGGHLSANVLSHVTLTAPSSAHDDLEKKPQYDDDAKVMPAAVSAARWAYILYQSPVMVAVHAAELLKTATS